MSNKYLCQRDSAGLNSAYHTFLIAPNISDAEHVLQCEECSIREGASDDPRFCGCKGPVDCGSVEVILHD